MAGVSIQAGPGCCWQSSEGVLLLSHRLAQPHVGWGHLLPQGLLSLMGWGEAIGCWELGAAKSLLETGQDFRHKLNEHLGRLPRVGAGSLLTWNMSGACPGCSGQQHRVQGGEDGKRRSASALGIPVKCRSLQLPRSAQTALFSVTCSSASLLHTVWFNASRLA